MAKPGQREYTEIYEKISQSEIRPFNTGRVVKQMKLEYKDFPATQGVYCIFLENYKWIENAPFSVEVVPKDTNKSTLDKKNYHCLDVQQHQPKPVSNKKQRDNNTEDDSKSNVMRGFVVKEARQSVFFSANKNQGFLMVTKPKDKPTQYLRPFLCSSIFKQRQDELSEEFLQSEIKPSDDGMSKLLRTKGKLPMEVFLTQNAPTKQTREKKEESEFYVDADTEVEKREIKKIKQQKRQAREDYEEGNIDNEDVLDTFKNERDEDGGDIE